MAIPLVQDFFFGKQTPIYCLVVRTGNKVAVENMRRINAALRLLLSVQSCYSTHLDCQSVATLVPVSFSLLGTILSKSLGDMALIQLADSSKKRSRWERHSNCAKNKASVKKKIKKMLCFHPLRLTQVVVEVPSTLHFTADKALLSI